MADVCAKVLKLQAPPKLKNKRDTSRNENETVTQLREKMHKLKFRLLDTQNQNQMLRKELKIANKVMSNEMPALRSGDLTGNEEATVCLRSEIAKLQKQIEQIEGNFDPQKDEKAACPEELKQKPMSSNLPKKQSSAEKLIGGCIEVKAKVDYWRNRNADLEKLSAQVRLELDRLVDKSEENRQIQREYGCVERELHARQAERLEMRAKLDSVKTKNFQLSEELAMLREDADRIRSKTDDDNMLLEALTSQQGNFQDLIDRQRMLGQSDHRRFREDLRQVHVKYTTSCNLMEQLGETAAEKDSLLQYLQDYRPLLTYVRDEVDEEKENSEAYLTATEVEIAENLEDPKPVEADPPPPPDPQLWYECERCERLFESGQEEVEQLAEIAINNNRKLKEWQHQLRESKATSAQKSAELRGLQASIQTLESLDSSKGTKSEVGKEGSSSTMEELLIKLDIEHEVHRFLDRYWHTVEVLTDSLFQIYATGADRTTKIFIDRLKQMKKTFEKQASAEEIGLRDSRTENERKSS